MDPNLILAALVLFIKMDVHHPSTVKEMMCTLVPDIHTLGGNNAANGIIIMVNANQRVNIVISFFIFKLEIL